jgi:crotonobetaine/carnitine-CoA ligase
MIELLKGQGAKAGPFTTRFPIEQRTMLHVLQHQVEARPDHPWLHFVNGSLTFKQAQQQAHRFAHALGSACHVGLFLRNQVEFFPSLYGAQAAHGVAVPLNADARGVLLQKVIEKAEIKVLVAREDLLGRLRELDGLGQIERIVVAGHATGTIHGAELIPWNDFLDHQPDTPPRELPHSSDVAIIQFTSGTTGDSKGVVYPHHFFYLYSSEVTDGQQHTPDDVLSTPLPLFHVAAIHIISNSALHAGCTAHLKERFSASTYWQEIAEDGATFAILLGPLAQILLKAEQDAPPHKLRKLFCLPFPPDGKEFERRFDTTLLWQGYGMTEVYPHPMQATMIPDVPFDTVGHAVEWFDYGAVDEDDHLLKPNEVGQLVYRCNLRDGMAREYYKAPEATAEAFRNGVFHTGDVGFVDEEGRVHFRGRLQDRIRRRGENISAAELEFIALGHPAIIEAAAFGVPGEFGEHEVKLDIVSADPDLDPHEYHAWLQEKLPRFMVPRYLEVRDELPKSPSEKVQKHKLIQADLDRPEVLTFEPARRA